MTPRTPAFRFVSAVFAALLCCLSLSAESVKEASFDIPSGSAAKALKQFSAQSGQQLLYSNPDLAGITTNEVKGKMSASEALDKLLAGTPLTATRDSKNGAIAVGREKADPNVARAIANNSDRPNEKSDVSRNEDGKVVLDTFEVFGRKSLNMDVKRTQDDIQPYVIFDRKAIQASGTTTLEGFLSKSVTSASISAEFAQTSAITAVAIPGIRLRGLNPNETLILVDGRRMSQRGSAVGAGGLLQADLNGIPLSAIERIDVLPTSASGIYGGNATGGVINIILRRDYSSVELSLTYGNTFDTDVNYRRMELNGGYTFEKGRTNLMFALSASDGGELWLQDRDFRERYFAINRAILPPTDPLSVDGTSIVPTGATPNIRSTNGQNLTLKTGGALNSLITSVPTGYAGPTSDNGAGLIAAAGKYNYEFAPLSGSGATVLRHTPEQTNYLITLRREMSTWYSLFLDASGSRTTTTRFNGGLQSTVNLSATDLGNPFNQPISIRVPAYGTEGIDELRQTVMRISGGAIVKLPADWNLGLNYTWDENSSASTYAKIVNLLGSGGLSPAIAMGILNVFRDLRSYPIDYSPYFISIVPEITPVKVKGNNASARASGPLKIRPNWHPLQIATSVEYIDQALGEQKAVSPNFTGAINRTFFAATNQSSTSIYTEIKWPLILSEQKIPAVERFEIFAAGRYDSYRLHSTKPASAPSDANWTLPIFSQIITELDASTPMFGILYQPIKDLSFRANYAEGFLPPTVFQLVPGNTQFGNVSLQSQLVKDVQRGNEQIGPVDLTPGGNPDLRPETSESWSAGLIFTPRSIKGLRLSVDWVRIDKRDAIITPSIFTTDAFTQFNQAFPEKVTRAAPSDGFPVGKITAVQSGNVNFARLMVEAIDFAADYELPIGNYGTFTLSAKATNNIHLVQQFTPTAAQTETVGGQSFNGFMPEWRGTASITWQRRQLTMGVAGQYYSSTYYGVGNQAVAAQLGTNHFEAQAYCDIFVRYATGPNTRYTWLRNMEISLNVNNVFNAEPPVNFGTPYYFAAMGDARLANYLISVRKTF